MSVETNRLRSTRELLEAIVARLKALELEQGQPAFHRVEMFDLSDYEDAMTRLAMNQERTALIVWTDDEYEEERETVMLTLRRNALLDIFVSERRLDKPIEALTGGPEVYLPGVLGLRDLVVAAVTGEILEASPDSDPPRELIYGVPQNVARGIINSDDKKKFPARQILIIRLKCVGEWMQVGVGPNEAFA